MPALAVPSPLLPSHLFGLHQRHERYHLAFPSGAVSPSPSSTVGSAAANSPSPPNLAWQPRRLPHIPVLLAPHAHSLFNHCADSPRTSRNSPLSRPSPCPSLQDFHAFKHVSASRLHASSPDHLSAFNPCPASVLCSTSTLREDDAPFPSSRYRASDPTHHSRQSWRLPHHRRRHPHDLDAPVLGYAYPDQDAIQRPLGS